MKSKIKNKAKMFTGGKSKNWDREKNDYYATPPDDTRCFLENYFDINKFKNILEPACGEGHMSEVIREFNENITSYDLIDRGYQDKVINFLKDDISYNFDLIITNPPFSKAIEFVEKGLKISDTVVILAKIQLLEGISRSNKMVDMPLKNIYGSSSRINCWRGGKENNPKTGKAWSGAMFLAWYVFKKGYEGKPIYDWIV
jgi:hypothetical protein